MSDLDFSDDLEPDIHPDSLRVKEFDVSGAVLVIPSDAPIPSELTGVALPTGTLYQRVAALDVEANEEFSFVPVSGTELLALERVWRSFQRAPRVFALFDLPAARYDVLFTQAVRQIGIHRIDWPSISEALSSRLRSSQRALDKTSWNRPTEVIGQQENVQTGERAQQPQDLRLKKRMSGTRRPGSTTAEPIGHLVAPETPDDDS